MRYLLTLPELAKKYNQQTINVAYMPKHQDVAINPVGNSGICYYTLPIALDVLIKNKVWLAYDTDNDTIVRPPHLVGVGNHWLNTLTDDHKNRRIDINQYTLNGAN